MSIINNASPGNSLNILNLVDRVLLRKGKTISRIEVFNLLRPENLPEKDNAKWRFEKNLDFWIKEGLWVQDENEFISLPKDSAERKLPYRLLDIIIKNLNKAPDQSILDDKKTEPFIRAMTCLLAQRTYTFAGGNKLKSGKHGNGQEAINKWLPGERGVNESNELSSFLQLGFFLGFLEPLGSGYIVDPTRAIQPYLKEIFHDDKNLPIKVFINRLAEFIPLLDGGRFRCLIEPLMKDLGWAADSEGYVSASLSHTLMRLENSFVIELKKSSDTEGSMQLQLPSNEAIKYVSHVVYRV